MQTPLPLDFEADTVIALTGLGMVAVDSRALRSAAFSPTAMGYRQSDFSASHSMDFWPGISSLSLENTSPDAGPIVVERGYGIWWARATYCCMRRGLLLGKRSGAQKVADEDWNPTRIAVPKPAGGDILRMRDVSFGRRSASLFLFRL
jgi:hypothetical protein